MRRPIAVLVLLVGATSQLSALDCPMAGAADPRRASAAPEMLGAAQHSLASAAPVADGVAHHHHRAGEDTRRAAAGASHEEKDARRTETGAPDATQDAPSPVPGPHDSGPDCRLLVTCTAGVLTAARPSLASEPRPMLASATPPAERNHATVFPNHETPPPRLPV